MFGHLTAALKKRREAGLSAFTVQSCDNVEHNGDLKPYEEMKLRLLNAGHSVLGLLGSVFGYQTIDECVRYNLFSDMGFLKRWVPETLMSKLFSTVAP